MFNKDRGENLKTWLEILSTVIVGCLFFTLLIFPGRLRWWCNRGGFDECNVFGQRLTQAQKENLQTQERVTAEALADINKVLENKDILSENQVETLKNAELKLSNSLTQLTPLVDEVASTGNWGIVFGGDVNYSSARDEIERANRIGYNQARIYFREGSYRSVVPFGSRESARDALSEVRELSFNKDAYLVNLANWCPNPVIQEDQAEQYFTCN